MDVSLLLLIIGLLFNQYCHADDVTCDDVMSELRRLDELRQQRIIELEQEIRELKKDFKSYKDENYVGFTAYNGGQYNVPQGETVVFDSTLANYSPTGGNYDTSNGIFTCPADGMYYFSVTGLSMEDEDCFVDIMLGGTAMTTSASPGNSNWLQGSNSVLVACTTGTSVSIRCAGPQSCDFTKSGESVHENSKFSSFAGFLIALA